MGMLFDHGIDAIVATILAPYLLKVMQTGDTPYVIFMNLVSLLPFFNVLLT
jgi:hypothetical protein